MRIASERETRRDQLRETRNACKCVLALGEILPVDRLFAGWLASLLGAMEAGRRIRRVRFCMHFCMPIDSVMKHNFTAPGSHLELRRASSCSVY